MNSHAHTEQISLKNFESKFEAGSFKKIAELSNSALEIFLAESISHLSPEKVFVSDGSTADIDFIKAEALKNKEELELKTKGHRFHVDSYFDQARDKENTSILLPKGETLGPFINTKEREAALADVKSILNDSMKGRVLYVAFYCLGPLHSVFSIPCVQLTDSSYVVHNENLLYRQGYEEFKSRKNFPDFFRFTHTEGELVDGPTKTTKDVSKRRVFIDLYNNAVYSTNTQYGGNSIGLKKLAMRLTILKASREGWLTEHMLLMGIPGPKGRRTYVAGAYPSMCGKTSTAMISIANGKEKSTIVGDDISYLRLVDGKVMAVNTEYGMFGIIADINAKHDPHIYSALERPGDIIFSDVLMLPDKSVYWIGKDDKMPDKGINHSGEWFKGKTDAKGKEINVSHKNARFTLNLKSLPNVDPKLDDPAGVPLAAIIYGGRDSDTSVPVEEAFDWSHGIIIKGASLESETTAATLGSEGRREFNPMANLDFLSIPIGKYIKINVDFGSKAGKAAPPIFSVNYFLRRKSDGVFLNSKNDKAAWLAWIERRSNGEVKVLRAPTGFIPLYEDLQNLFKETLNQEYTREQYLEQFTIRIPENLAKLERIENIYKNQVSDTPSELFKLISEQRARLLEAQKKFGDYITPDKLSLA